jgi:hypothetical protein
MFTNAFSMLYNLFEQRDSFFSSLTFAMIANDAHSSHGIVLLLVLKVRNACPSSIWGVVVIIDNDDKGQLVSAAGSPLRKCVECVVARIGHCCKMTISFRGARRRSIEPPSLT